MLLSFSRRLCVERSLEKTEGAEAGGTVSLQRFSGLHGPRTYHHIRRANAYKASYPIPHPIIIYAIAAILQYPWKA